MPKQLFTAIFFTLLLLPTVVSSQVHPAPIAMLAKQPEQASSVTIDSRRIALQSTVAFYHPLPLGQEGPVLELAFFEDQLSPREQKSLQSIVSVGSAIAVQKKIGKAPLVHLSLFFKEGAAQCDPSAVRLAFFTVFDKQQQRFPHRSKTITFDGNQLSQLQGLSTFACKLHAGESIVLNWQGAHREHHPRPARRFSWELASSAVLVHQ